MKAIILVNANYVTHTLWLINKLNDEDEQRLHERALEHGFRAVVRDVTHIDEISQTFDELERLDIVYNGLEDVRERK